MTGYIVMTDEGDVPFESEGEPYSDAFLEDAGECLLQHSVLHDSTIAEYDSRDRYQLKDMYIRMFVRYRIRGICVFKFADGRSVLELDEGESQ